MDGEQDKYRTFFGNVPAMVCFVDFDGRILELNRAWETSTGFSREELAGQPWAGFIHPEDIEAAWAGQKKAMSGEPATAQLRIRCKGGSYKWFLISGYADKDRSVLYTAASDISALKETETSLRASEHQLRRIIDKAPISMAIVGMDEKIEYINRRAEETFGYPSSEIPTMKDWWEKAYPDEAYRKEVLADWMGRVMDGIKRNGEIAGNQYRVTCRDRSVKTCFIYGVIAAGKVFVMFEDISERVKTGEMLQTSEKRLKSILEEAPVAIAVSSKGGKLEMLNRKFTQIFGYTLEDIPDLETMGREVYPDERYRQEVISYWAEVQSASHDPGEELHPREFRVRCKDGTYRTVISSTVVTDDDKIVTINEDVTEQVAAEQVLRESETNLRSVLEQAPIGIMLRTLDGGIEFLNRKFTEQFGYTVEDIPTAGKWQECALPDETYRREMMVPYLRRLGEVRETGGELPPMQLRITCKDGTVKQVSLTGMITRDKKVLTLLEDISERARAQEELRFSESTLRSVIEQAPISIAVYSLEGKLDFLNRKFTHTFGYLPEEIPTAGDWMQKAYPDKAYREQLNAKWAALLEKAVRTNGEIEGGEYRVVAKDGTDRTVFIHGVVTAGKKVVCLLDDVTSRVRTERALRESESTLRRILDQAPIAIAVHTLEGNIEFTNRKFTEAYGYQLEDIPTLETWMRRAYPDPQYREGLLDMWKQWMDNSLRTGQAMPGTEVRVRCRDGRTKYVFVTGVVTPDRKVVSLLDDITGRVESERALRERESLYRALVETTRTGYVVIDGQGRVVDANREYVRLAGFTDLKQIMGRSVLDWTAPHEKARNAAAVAKCARDGHIHNFEVEYVNPEGETTPIEINATVVSRDGVNNILTLCRDISQRRRRLEELRAFNEELEKRVAERTAELKKANIGLSMEIAQRMDAERNTQKLQQELQRAQRMEALGQLAGGIAHDFNNILVAISGYAEFLMSTLPGDSPGRADLSEIMHETERGAALTRQLSTIGRKEPENPRDVDLSHDIEDACRMLKRLIGADIRLETRLVPGLPRVCAGVGQISQLVMNLVLNARDAMPDGGRIIVTTGLQDFTGGDGMPITPAPGKYVFMEVQDDGQGMTPETARQAFEPFFTTKESGKGTGLGLSVVYSIVKQAGGGIALTSSPGSGTAIRILLPPCAADRTAPSRRKP